MNLLFKHSIILILLIGIYSPARTQMDVLYVSFDSAFDLRLMDTLLEIPNISIQRMNDVNFSFLTTDQIASYDAVIIAEDIRSGQISNFRNAGFPIPVVCFKAYAVNRWELLNWEEGIDWDMTPKDSTYEEADYIIMENNTHAVFSGLGYAPHDTIQWTLGKNDNETGEAHAVGFDLSLSPIETIKTHSTLLAKNLQLVNEDKIPGCFWAIEENDLTKRIIFWNIHFELQQKATPDFFVIAKNALKWALKLNNLISDIKIDGSSLPNLNEIQNVYHYELCSYRDPSLIPEIKAVPKDTNTIIVIESGLLVFDTVNITAIKKDSSSRQKITIIFDPVDCPEYDTICSGETVNLDGVPEGGNSDNYTFSWSSIPAGYSSSSDTVIVIVSSSTTFTVTATHDSTQQSMSKNFYIVVGPSTPKPHVIQKGESLLICTDSVSYRYNWYFNDELMQAEHKQFLEFNPSYTGYYQVGLYILNVCESKSDKISPKRNVKSTNILESPEIYPNPNDGTFNVVVNNDTKGKYSIDIQDLAGKIIAHREFTKNIYPHSEEITLENIPKGLYIIIVSFQNQKIVSTFIQIE
ncbi:MAG: T9SS type A sorting domain-containing protein [Bacteroidales bacterium]|nr:T9SS type A sorting domain-containing protein [Bacteroidales bacterium]